MRTASLNVVGYLFSLCGSLKLNLRTFHCKLVNMRCKDALSCLLNLINNETMNSVRDKELDEYQEHELLNY